MKKNAFRKKIDDAVPAMPGSFAQAMLETLDGIKADERARVQAGGTEARPAYSHMKRTVVFALAAVLLVGAVALATGILKHNVFELTVGESPKTAGNIIQYDLAKESFDECDIEVKEAAYDGVSLYVVFSIRDRDATEPIGEYDPETDTYYVGENTFPAMQRDDIGWWDDGLWIDGEDVPMPGMSGGNTVGSETPGELLFYMMFRLDQENVYLNGENVEIALPIGKRQSRDSLVIDRSGEKAKIQKPKDGLVTFCLDCSIRDGVTIDHPNIETELDGLTAKASEVTYSPIQTYLTLDLQVAPDAVSDYVTKNGEGVCDEAGNLVVPFDGGDVAKDWLDSLMLVDGNGKPVFDSRNLAGLYGLQQFNAEHAWFTFPYLATFPEQMYLAPVNGDTADMTQAVRVK
jgi:hypothetical protein